MHCRHSHPLQGSVSPTIVFRQNCNAQQKPCRGTHRPAVCSQGAVLVLPAFLSGSKPYGQLVDTLNNLDFTADVVPLKTTDWATVLAGGDFQFYLKRLDTALTAMHAKHGPVALVGHSAGGWIARILLGEVPYQGTVYNRSNMVHSLVTLGTPHHSIEKYPLGRVSESLSVPPDVPADVRGSSLRFANHFYPRADCWPGVQVVCLVGNSIAGRELWSPGDEKLTQKLEQNLGLKGASIPPQALSQAPSRLESFVAYQSYKSGCGRGDVAGDGITPIEIAHLPGALNLVLDGVWHGPQGRPGRPWYGDVLERWVQYLVHGYAEP